MPASAGGTGPAVALPPAVTIRTDRLDDQKTPKQGPSTPPSPPMSRPLPPPVVSTLGSPPASPCSSPNVHNPSPSPHTSPTDSVSPTGRGTSSTVLASLGSLGSLGSPIGSIGSSLGSMGSVGSVGSVGSIPPGGPLAAIAAALQAEAAAEATTEPNPEKRDSTSTEASTFSKRDSISTDCSVFSVDERSTFLVASEDDIFEVAVKVYHPGAKGILKKGPCDSDMETDETQVPRARPARKKVEFVEGLVTGVAEAELVSQDSSEHKEGGHARSRSTCDVGELGMLELRESDIEDPASVRAAYKDRVRMRGERKGRKWQQQTVQTYEDNQSSAQESAFKADTERMEKERDQLEIDVFSLEQDIREKNKDLEKKKKLLEDLQRQLSARPHVWAKILDPSFVPPVEVEKPTEALDPGESKEILRYRVQKLGNYIFSKDQKRWLEINFEAKSLELYNRRKGDGEIISANQIASCPQAMDRSSPVLIIKYYGDTDRRLLRALKEMKLKFDTPFLKERIYRVLREMLPQSEKRGPSTFVYKPQPLPISDKTQTQVNTLPVFKLASELHAAWMERKEATGWKYGSTQDDVAKTHPHMCDFENLSREDQKYCLGIANLTLAGIFELGYSIKKAQGNQKSISPQLRPLIEFLAENAHESWADLKIKSGWRYDAKAESSTKSHPELVPYCELEESVKEADREVVNVSVAFLFKSGFCITRNVADLESSHGSA